MSGHGAHIAHRVDGLSARIIELSRDLRAAGVDASLVEVLDAVRALQHVDVGDRAIVRTALGSTLVKRPEDREVFDVLFDRHLPLTGPGASQATRSTGDVVDALVPGTVSAVDPTAAAASVARAISVGDDDALALLVAEAIDTYGDLDGTRAGERYYLYRIMRALDLANVLVAVMAQARAEGLGGLALRARRDEARERLERFRRLLAAEVRRRLPAAAVGPPGLGLMAPRRIEDLDVLRASTTELRQLRAAVRPLARKLATRVGQQRRRHRRGRLDVRRTLRRSLDAGGAPMDPAFRRRRASKPRLVVLCDLSGSVAEFAHFTLALLHALRDELAGLRAFAFVDGVAEVTTVLERAEVALDPRLLVTLPGVVAHDGHSDYERALAAFVSRYGDAIGPGTTVLVTGDARTNYRPSGAATLAEIRRRGRRVYWFNPEPAAEWDEGDSAVTDYRAWCDGVFEVRSLTQLADAVAAIM